MSTPTVADIMREGLADFQSLYGPLSSDARKATSAIVSCHSEALGGRRMGCDRCGHELTIFNSCRNRHCPACQTPKRVQWVHDRIDDLLPVGYFHAVFTVPRELAPFALRNRATFYNLMFRAVNETLADLSHDTKRLGATLGFIQVLHTWGQNLLDHPHIHCIVPGGGLDEKRGRWTPCKKRFLFPIPVLQTLYRGKLLDFFATAVRDGSIQLHGELDRFSDPASFKALLDTLYNKTWVVYVKPPFASPQAVIKYLGQYTHRVAISNQRILSLSSGMVTFAHRDNAAGGARKTMTITCVEFIRRFLMHVVPKGFVRIRHCGFLANRNRSTKLTQCREIFHKKPPTNRKEKSAVRCWSDAFKELTGRDPSACPVCKLGTLVVLALLPRLVHGPLPAMT